MKPSKNFCSVLLLLTATLGFTACQKDKAPPKPAQTITQIVVERPDFSLLRAAVVRAGLAETLNGAGPFTVFAPTNEAFVAAGFSNEAAINALPVETLRTILLYHVLGQRVAAAAIPEGANTAVATLAEADFYVTKSGNSVSVNGARMVQADVLASNGIIHAVDKVILPPSGNVVATLVGDDNFSLLVAAVLHASTGTTNVAEVLSGNGPFTVFAPTNAAFTAAGLGTETAIQAIPPDDLLEILTYHVVSGRIFSTNLSNGATPETINGATVTIGIGDDVTITGVSNTSAAKVTQADWTTTNGVIHVIDQVLLP